MRRVARNVKRFREEQGLSQQGLADKAKIHRVYLAKIEGAVYSPSLEVRERLAKARKVTVGELVK